MTPKYIYEELTWPQVRMYMQQVATLEYRRHLPMAQLTATVLNGLGGKPKGDQPPSDVQPFTALELLPSYAQLEAMIFNPAGVTEQAAQEFFRLTRAKKLPSWVLAVSNISQFRSAAGLKA